MSRRGEVLELAVLGLLHEGPMHGYELRKRLNSQLGVFRALSYGTLYPALKTLQAHGWVQEQTATRPEPTTGGLTGGGGPLTAGALTAGTLTGGAKRARIVYELTAEGKEHFQSLVSSAGSDAWEDGSFDVHFAFFARTDAATRLRILEGRRMRLQERLELLKASKARSRERLDAYTLELQRHGQESVEREVRWLSDLIDSERSSNMTHPPVVADD